MKNNTPVLTSLLLTLLASCNPTPVQPPPPLDLNALVNKCNTACSSEEENQVRTGITPDLPDTLSGDDTPELKLKGYTGPVTWTLEGPGALFGPGITWTIDNCKPVLLRPGEACSYSGADRWLYIPAWKGGVSGSLKFRATAGRFTFEKTSTLTVGTLAEDERHALQFVNHVRAIPYFCTKYEGPQQPSVSPLRWDKRLKQTAQKTVSASKIVSNEVVMSFAEEFGYRAKGLAQVGTFTISDVAGGGVSQPDVIEPDRLYKDASFGTQRTDSHCTEFHDPVFRDFAASAGFLTTGLLNTAIIASYE